jgi:hypothetical protein
VKQVALLWSDDSVVGETRAVCRLS